MVSGAGGTERGAAPSPAVTPLAGRGVFVLLPCVAHNTVRTVCTEGGLCRPLDSHCLHFGDDLGFGNDRKMEELMKLVLIPRANSSLSKCCFVLEMRCGTRVPASEQTPPPPHATLDARGLPVAWDVSEALSLSARRSGSPRACGAGRETVCMCVCVGEPSALLEGLLHPLITKRLTGHFPIASLNFYFSLSCRDRLCDFAVNRPD